MATMTMAPTSAFEPSPTFPRAHSSAALKSLASNDFKRSEQNVTSTELPRSASFSSVPGLLENPAYVQNNETRNYSSENLPLTAVPENEQNFLNVPEKLGAEVKAEQQVKEERPKMGRRKSLVARPKSWIMRVKGTPENTISEMNEVQPSMPNNIKSEKNKVEKGKPEKNKVEKGKPEKNQAEKGKQEKIQMEKNKPEKEAVPARQPSKLTRTSPAPTTPKETRTTELRERPKTTGRSNRKSWFGGSSTTTPVVPAMPVRPATAVTPTSRSPSPTKMNAVDADSSSREDEDVSTAPSSLASSSPRLPVALPATDGKPAQAPTEASVKAPSQAIPPASSSSTSTVTTESNPTAAPIPTFKVTDAPNSTPTRKPTILQKMKRPSSMLVTSSSMKNANFSTSSLPPASMPASAASSPKTLSPRESMEKVPTIPKSVFSLSSEKLLDMPRKRDELWSAFRSLDTDYQKFQTKSSALKTNVVRSTLLPFLRNHANHPSNKMLRPEDLDRRCNIFNKWWTGILEMLDGHSNQTVSGIDRPVLLDAITGIMTRSEWRLSPSQFAPLQERTSVRVLPRTRSSGSLNSTASQFLAESVYHNVRNTFIQNLLSQISLVVDKMSLRHAPASLVTFCGKAAAYAFFFCPGVGEQLAQLWSLPAGTLRRVVDDLGIPRGVHKSDYSEDLISAFPPTMQSLGWASLAKTVKQLRQKPNLPLGAAKIPWQGPWIARWCGRDSDLFFVFCKHYHILVEEFLPPNMPLKEKARAPGFVLVHAQILTVLDMTIHRQTAGDAPIPITFDDVLAGGADASATALPLPPSNNVTRLMAENRLIMLLRDFLSERPSNFDGARQLFAEAFGAMTRAAAKGTSLFDHNGSFVLCDFLEEALAIYIRYHHGRVRNASSVENLIIVHQDFIDWGFWLEVCKRILHSQNSMSEIRLFSFIYTAWNILTADEKRKEILCLEWLLTEDTFERMFGHWCPMVRAYYMRLLCWRVARHDGEATPLDTKILAALAERLKSVWGHFLHLRQEAIDNNRVPPSSAPCLPAPGRRLFIIRNDHQNPAPGLFLGFDGIVPPSLGATKSLNKAAKRHSTLSLDKMSGGSGEAPKLPSPPPPPRATIVLSPPPPEPITTPPKKKWGLLGKLSPFSSSTKNEAPAAKPSEVTKSTVPAKTSTSAELATVRAETAAARTPNKLTKSRTPSPSGSTETLELSPSSHRAFCFKFSLEWHQQPPSAGPQRNLRLAPPRLPAPAHSWLGSHAPGLANAVQPKVPAGVAASTSKYAGRAIAEWTIIVMECNNFVERRRSEGVPNLKCVEIPTLGVEGFRKFA